MELGMTAVSSSALRALLAADVNALFRSVGIAIMQTMGGASGVIFGTMLFGAVQGLEPINQCLKL